MAHNVGLSLLTHPLLPTMWAYLVKKSYVTAIKGRLFLPTLTHPTMWAGFMTVLELSHNVGRGFSLNFCPFSKTLNLILLGGVPPIVLPLHSHLFIYKGNFLITDDILRRQSGCK